nr:hypothetical protein [Tanacetum cinerariifolium]
MMVLMMHTEEDDTVLHIVKTGMLMLVDEVDMGGMSADVVDKLTCSSDDVQPKQVVVSSSLRLLKPNVRKLSLDPTRDPTINLIRTQSMYNTCCSSYNNICEDGNPSRGNVKQALGLAVDQLEGRLVEYKEREVKYIENIRTLEMYKESNLKCIKALDKELETLKEEKDVVDGKLACLLKSLKDLESLIESQRPEKIKDRLGYNAVPPPAADLYLSPKKDLSWTTEPVKKPIVKYAEMYRRPSKKPTVRGNQRNWNNLKTQQLGSDFAMKKKACYNYGDFSHLA